MLLGFVAGKAPNVVPKCYYTAISSELNYNEEHAYEARIDAHWPDLIDKNHVAGAGHRQPFGDTLNNT